MRKTRKAAPSVTRSIPIAVETVERRIHYIQGQKVMLDTDLAELYHVQTSNLNKAVKRNKERFPQDFHVSADEGGDEFDIPEWNIKDGEWKRGKTNAAVCI